MSVSTVSFQDANLSMEDLLNQDRLDVHEIASGSVITGKIVGFHPDEKSPEDVIIDMGSKSEGKISIKEFDDKPHIGDEVEALVKSYDKESGLVTLSRRALEKARGWEIVQEMFEKNLPVTGMVKRGMKNGFLVNIEGLPMFLPHSHIGNLVGSPRSGKKIDVIGQTFTFRILELNARRQTGVVSRKAFQDEQNQQIWADIDKKIKIGEIAKAIVMKHTRAGAFLEIQGVLGFLHKSNITWERKVGILTEKLPLGSEIQVRVLEIDPENHRLSLGLKQMTEDPWVKVLESVSVGDIIKGKVTYVANYGAFIDIGNGLEGLLHTSEMSWTRKIGHAQEIVKLGQELETKVIGINPADKRISLGLRQLQENPWDRIKSEYKIGQSIKGKVKDVTNFGIFVAITDDIDGLVRREDINWDEPAPDPKKLYKSGDDIEFKITEINFEDRKIGCSMRHLLPNPYKELRKKYPRGTVIDGIISGIVDFGVFVKFDNKYEGLAHISTVKKEQSLSLKTHFKKGDPIKAVIRHIDPDNRKISLSLKDVDYAVERLEIAQYIEKEDRTVPSGSPFSALRDFVQK